MYVNPLTDDIMADHVVDGTLRTGPTAPASWPLGDGPLPHRTARRRAALPAAVPRPATQELHLLSPPLAPAVFERLPPMSDAAPTSTPFAGRYHSADLEDDL